MSMNTKTDRFARPPLGSQFSETHYVGTSFNVPNPNHVPRDREEVAEKTEKGRPLWLSEINKNVPAGAQYDIESTFGNTATLFRTRAKAFQSSNCEQNKTMREEPHLSNFRDTCQTHPQEGVASYDIKLS